MNNTMTIKLNDGRTIKVRRKSRVQLLMKMAVKNTIAYVLGILGMLCIILADPYVTLAQMINML